MTNNATINQDDPILKTPAIARASGLSISTILRLERTGKMPRRHVFSSHLKGLRRSEVDAWLANPSAYAQPDISR